MLERLTENGTLANVNRLLGDFDIFKHVTIYNVYDWNMVRGMRRVENRTPWFPSYIQLTSCHK